jgi:hypothetical protein
MAVGNLLLMGSTLSRAGQAQIISDDEYLELEMAGLAYRELMGWFRNKYSVSIGDDVLVPVGTLVDYSFLVFGAAFVQYVDNLEELPLDVCAEKMTYRATLVT